VPTITVSFSESFCFQLQLPASALVDTDIFCLYGWEVEQVLTCKKVKIVDILTLQQEGFEY
jgi:hypothetical protein